MPPARPGGPARCAAGIGLDTARLLAGRGARVTIGGRDRDRLAAAARQLSGQAEAVPVDAGVGPVTQLAEADLPGAFAGKTIAHLRAVAVALPILAGDGSITLVTAGSMPSHLG